ncbi:MAG: hypothetical protein UX26_C0018G0012 [Parcubacteria group bacterium GW2011_GWC1_45_9]|uniref:Uncharacterized protein n=1 Tax=Candidatus Woesebacteria bacterium GW2011_GWB1_44_11b TaxID=1618580 RepID=A0A0G1GID4_9BACT|nr:MAG: hypothetical protein UW21_C0004G0013 [Candidatus Woesebacteria bacterium GW2011_GWB1_44_11b]KKT86431.1 MAG: hypothetical protein UW85_C0002G0032 [Parcubacteria group bacterium GW2011_GWA1_Parcubacteria_45_10]KKU16690.1 MAG: hypothetical protein UX26_C0018G0012 [Parcubacteria group bacterium GW2011_GWC1_45_9]HCI05423.1 hypothetical protein [Patescibacteria group bacterium]
MASAQELFDQAREWSELAHQLYSEANQLWGDCEEIQEETQGLKNEVDDLTSEIDRLFRESREAYDDDDHDLAKELSVEAHEKIDERREVRDRFFALIEDHKELFARVKGKQEEARQAVEQARYLRMQAKALVQSDQVTLLEGRVSDPHRHKDGSFGPDIEAYRVTYNKGKEEVKKKATDLGKGHGKSK